MLAEAQRTDPEAWASKFDPLYKGRSYIFDTPGRGRADGRGLRGLTRSITWSSPRARRAASAMAAWPRPDRFAHIDLTGFELFELAHPAKGNSVTFGAKLASFRFDNDKNHWVVQLEPKSGVFMTHPRALEALGWPAAELIDPPAEEGQP